jgi:Zn-dependent metalloprotease
MALIATAGLASADVARFKIERARAAAALAELQRIPGGDGLRVDWPAHRVRPAAIRGLLVATAGETDEARARSFLARHPGLAVESGLGGNLLRLLDTRRAHGQRALRFQLEHRGLEVLGATVVVGLDDSGRVTALASEAEPIALSSVQPSITPEAALASARTKAGAVGRGGVARLAILAEGTPRLVYRVRLPYPADPKLGRFHLVDAASGGYLGWRQTGVVESFAGTGVRR